MFPPCAMVTPMIAGAGLFLSTCSNAEPFDPARCKIEVETRLADSFAEESWRLEQVYYPSLAFVSGSGDVDLLDKYMKRNGYFPVAMDPDDPESRKLRIYSADGSDDRRRDMARPATLSRVACEASYVSRAKLKSVWVMSGMEPAFRIEF